MPRVLLVEDSPTNQLLARGLLEEAGYEVTIVDNGEEAVTSAGGGGFDLVLMDILLPGIDGCEATRQIRSQNQAPLPILAMTGETEADGPERYREAGMNGCLSKPLELDELEAALTALSSREDSTATG